MLIAFLLANFLELLNDGLVAFTFNTFNFTENMTFPVNLLLSALSFSLLLTLIVIMPTLLIAPLFMVKVESNICNINLLRNKITEINNLTQRYKLKDFYDLPFENENNKHFQWHFGKSENQIAQEFLYSISLDKMKKLKEAFDLIATLEKNSVPRDKIISIVKNDFNKVLISHYNKFIKLVKQLNLNHKTLNFLTDVELKSDFLQLDRDNFNSLINKLIKKKDEIDELINRNPNLKQFYDEHKIQLEIKDNQKIDTKIMKNLLKELEMMYNNLVNQIVIHRNQIGI